MAWKKSPTLNKSTSKFLQRLYEEDFIPCLTFPNQELAMRVIKAVETNSIIMSPIIMSKSEIQNGGSPPQNSSANSSAELPRNCALFDAPLICNFKVILEENEEFEISHMARNRIAAACECINYLRYICEGLVKAHHNEVYWEIVKRRRKLILAKLGYSPDED